jgi:hypothetical protein
MSNVVSIGGEPKTPTQLLLEFANDPELLESLSDVLIVTMSKDGEIHGSNNAMSAERMVYLATAIYQYATR